MKEKLEKDVINNVTGGINVGTLAREEYENALNRLSQMLQRKKMNFQRAIRLGDRALALNIDRHMRELDRDYRYLYNEYRKNY